MEYLDFSLKICLFTPIKKLLFCQPTYICTLIFLSAPAAAMLIYMQCFPGFTSLNTKALNIENKGLMEFKKFEE